MLDGRQPIDQEVGEKREWTDGGMDRYEDVIPVLLLQAGKEEGVVNSPDNLKMPLCQQKAFRYVFTQKGQIPLAPHCFSPQYQNDF